METAAGACRTPTNPLRSWPMSSFHNGMQGGRDTHRGNLPGFGSGEGPSSGTSAKHMVRIHNPAAGQEVEVEVPEDR